MTPKAQDTLAPKNRSSAEFIPSATTVLLRDTERGVETLLLQKNAKITFGGSWVFPGGRIDDEDRKAVKDKGVTEVDYETERLAAVRECAEETSILINPEQLIPYSRWFTPVIRPKRFSALFFIYDATSINQSITIDHGEIVDEKWFSLKEVLKLHNDKQLVLAGPAFVTLQTFMNFPNVEAIKLSASQSPLLEFVPRIQLGPEGAISVYHGDDGYSLLNDTTTSKDPKTLEKIESATRQHRLYMNKEKPWQYVQSVATEST